MLREISFPVEKSRLKAVSGLEPDNSELLKIYEVNLINDLQAPQNQPAPLSGTECHDLSSSLFSFCSSFAWSIPPGSQGHKNYKDLSFWAKWS